MKEASSETADIDSIEDIMSMFHSMESLDISPEEQDDLLDKMKHQVKETLQNPENKASWRAKEVGIYIIHRAARS